MPSISSVKRTPGDPGLSQIQVMNALAVIDSITSARDAAECLERLFQATQAIGATAGLYSVAIPENGADLSSITMFACDPGFAQQVFDLGLDSHPWVRFARQHTSPGTGRQVACGTAADAAALDLARNSGFGSYLIVPMLAGAELGRVELLCLGKGPDDGFEGEDQRIVRLLARALATELHDWFSVHLRTGLQQAARLQAADIHLLAFEWEGLSTKQIAQRTGMSMVAVDSRFQRLNQRLNCPNRKASARRAAEYSVLDAVRPGTTVPVDESTSRISDEPGDRSGAPKKRRISAPRLRRRAAAQASPGSQGRSCAPCTPSSVR